MSFTPSGLPVRKPTSTAGLLMLAGAGMISFSAVFVKIAAVSPTASAFYRVSFGFCFLFAMAAIRHELARPSFRQLALLIGCGLAFALDLYFWHESIHSIGPGLATLIGNFQVFFLAAFAILFFGDKPSFRFLLALPIAMVGLFLVVGIDWQQLDNTYKTGVYFALLTALCYAVYLIILRKFQSEVKRSPVYALMLVCWISSLLLGLKMLKTGDSFTIPDLTTLTALVALGLFCQTIGWMLIARALPRLPTALGGLMLLLQPALSFVWDVLFFNRPTSTLNWIGVALALAAIYMGARSRVGP